MMANTGVLNDELISATFGMDRVVTCNKHNAARPLSAGISTSDCMRVLKSCSGLHYK